MPNECSKKLYFFGETCTGYVLCKDQSEKKVTNVDAYISVIFSHILINFVRLEKQISVAFQRGTLYLCTFPME